MNRLYLAGIAAMLVGLTVLGVVAVNTAINHMTVSYPTERTKALLTDEEKETLAQRACPGAKYAVKHPEVMKYAATAYSTSCDYYHEFINGRKVERITIHIIGKETVKGDWSIGYRVSHIDNRDIILRIDSASRQFLNINVTRVHDENYNITYPDELQEVIDLAIQDHSVQQLLNGKNWYVRHVHTTGASHGGDCPLGSCYPVLIDEINRKETVVVMVNSATKKVIDVTSTPGW